MKNEMETNCPQCPRHCSKDALSCDKGRAYFGVEVPGDAREGNHGGHGGHGGGHFAELESMEPEQMSLAQLLIRCGFIAGKKMSHQNGADIISGLTDEEKSTMQQSLVKLLKAWKAEFHS